MDPIARGLASKALGDNAPKNSRPFVSNLTPRTLPKFRKAAAKVIAGTGRGRILCVGDSTTQGIGTSANAAGGLKSKAYPRVLKSQLAAAGLPAVEQSFMGSGNLSFANYQLYDPRVVAGSGWVFSSTTLGGAGWQNSSTTNALAFTPDVNIDTIEVYYVKNSGQGTFTVNVDGGATLATVATAGSAAMGKTTVTTTLGAHTINIVPPGSGTVTICGVIAYDSTTKAFDVINAGVGGSTTADWILNTSPWWPLNAFATYVPDLTVISLGINDYTPATLVSQSAYQANLGTLIDAAAAVGDVLLFTPFPSDATRQDLTIQAQYVAIAKAVAQAKGIACIDMVQRWGSYAASSYYYQGGSSVHPQEDGYADAAMCISRTLLAALG